MNREIFNPTIGKYSSHSVERYHSHLYAFSLCIWFVALRV